MLEILEQHQLIIQTIGYKGIKDISLSDLPQILKFLKVVQNYKKIKNIENEN